MIKLKYIIVLFITFSILNQAEALDIQYGSILESKGSTILAQYYGIGKKQNFLCNITTRKCTNTKKITLGITTSKNINKSLIQELKDKDAVHITLSPSSNLIAYYIGATETNPNRTFTIRNLKDGKEYITSDNVSYWDLVYNQGKVFDFSPDENKLAYLNDKDGVLSIYLSDITTLTDTTITSTKLSTIAYEINDFIFTDNQTLYYIGNTIENPYIWSLYRYDIKTKINTLITKNVSYTNSIKRIGKTLVFNQLQTKGYGLALYNLTTKKVQQFSIPNINIKSKITNEKIIQSDNIHGVLMTPTKNNMSKTYPLVIWLHGGPYRQTSLKFHPFHSYGIYDSILELLRKNNVIVFKLDYPGSLGYGRAYTESIKDSVGKIDVENVINAITYIKNRYHINNVYLAGNSYGGYLSLKTLVDHPDIITGVISINGVTDWESLLIKMKTSIFNTDFNGLPNLNNRSLYDQASIINKIDNIGDQKIDIIAGEADRTIPYWQATTLYNKLKNTNKNVKLISYKGEDHVYKEKKTIQNLCNQIFNFIGVKVDPECNK